MNDILKAMGEGFKLGARETPRGFFAPVIVFFRWLSRITDEEMRKAGPWDSRRMLATLDLAQQELDRVQCEMFGRLKRLDPELHTLVLLTFGETGRAATWMSQPSAGLGGLSPYQWLAAGNRARVVSTLHAIERRFGDHGKPSA